MSYNIPNFRRTKAADTVKLSSSKNEERTDKAYRLEKPGPGKEYFNVLSIILFVYDNIFSIIFYT